MVANRLLLERRDRVVAVGEAVRRALIQNEGIPSARVRVIYNGIDLSQFSPKGLDDDSIRREISIGDADLMIIQVARLDYLKDHATAIQVMEHLVKSHTRARLVLVGDGPELGKIEALTRKCGLTEHVRFLGLRTDVARLLHAADLFLLTSISEGIPLTLIEAMAAGLPVVATQVGGVPEVVQDGATGLLAPARDADSLAGKIKCLAGNPELRRQMSQRARDRARGCFSECLMHGKYLELYTEIVGGCRQHETRQTTAGLNSERSAFAKVVAHE
jgi:glycosyltransferase involved in cell wall biosynthesis